MQRKPGISAMVRVRNEAETILPSLRSILDVVDEVILVDNLSTDETPELVQTFKKELGLRNIHIFEYPFDIQKGESTLADFYNYAWSLTRHEWILKWDGDRIAYTSGPGDICYLRRVVQSPHTGYLFRYVNLWGDFRHISCLCPFTYEFYLMRHHPDIRYVVATNLFCG